VHAILFCNLQSRARTHAVLVIGLYELLCNPTTYNSLSHLGPLNCLDREQQGFTSPHFHKIWYICKTQIDVQSLIDVQFSNRRTILKYMAVFHFHKSTSSDVTDVCFKWRHTRYGMSLKQWWRRDRTRSQMRGSWWQKTKMYFIVTVDKILLCLRVLLLNSGS
jgi:hypothetical protein